VQTVAGLACDDVRRAAKPCRHRAPRTEPAHSLEFLMRNPIGIVVMIIGVVLLIYGISATDSLASNISELFTGRPTDKAIWLVVLGILGIGVGLALSFRRSSP